MYWGIDPSITNTGLVGLDDDGWLVVAEDCGPKNKELSYMNKLTRTEKYIAEAERVASFISKYGGPYYIAYEDYAYGEKGKDGHMLELAEYNGVLKSTLFKLGVNEIIRVPPTSLKSFIVNYGFAEKDEVKGFVKLQYPELAKRTNDVTDAAALAMFCLCSNNPHLADDIFVDRKNVYHLIHYAAPYGTSAI